MILTLVIAAALWGTPTPQESADARAASEPAASAPASAPAQPPAEGPKSHSAFDGTWRYNSTDSVNVTTGKPETARAVNQRRGLNPGATSPDPAAVALVKPPALESSDGTFYGGAGDSSAAPQDGTYNLYVEQRDAKRDLLEISPELRIDVDEGKVKVTDDLERVLAFSTDGRKQHYQLGAAVFDAKTTWEPGQLKTQIEGPDGLKISEVWFLNDDGSRLYLVIRVGDMVKGRPPVGVNRVYDRVK